MTDNLKLLAVDDSITYRTILSKVVSNLKDVELIGSAASGKMALIKIKRNTPDVVLLDLNMEDMNGIEVLEVIKKDYPDVEVVIISGVEQNSADLTLKALELGALDFIPKPRTKSLEESVKELTSILTTIVSLAKSRKYSKIIKSISSNKTTYKKSEKITSKPFKEKNISPPSPIKNKQTVYTKTDKTALKKNKPLKIDVVAIGVSTGGPNALHGVIPKIYKDIPVPILCVQHMPATFTKSLAERLNQVSAINVVEGHNGQLIEAGTMYIAPGGHHMAIKKTQTNQIIIKTLNTPKVNSCRPSVDVLFNSISDIYNGNVLMVMLTGMGNDGAASVKSIRQKGGYSVVQDEKTSVVWGMPGAVAEAGDADEILPLNKIADKIFQIVSNHR